MGPRQRGPQHGWSDAPWWWDVEAVRSGRSRSAASDTRPVRASDAERELALTALADEFAAGRLDAVEFGERQSRAQVATYVHELDPLFADLPARVAPTAASAAVVPVRRAPHPLAIARAGLVALSVLLVVLLGLGVVGTHPWLLLVPLLVLWMVGGRARRRRRWEMRYGVTRG
jgi:hypothetical protein